MRDSDAYFLLLVDCVMDKEVKSAGRLFMRNVVVVCHCGFLASAFAISKLGNCFATTFQNSSLSIIRVMPLEFISLAREVPEAFRT